jgi:hypothetical protein
LNFLSGFEYPDCAILREELAAKTISSRRTEDAAGDVCRGGAGRC